MADVMSDESVGSVHWSFWGIGAVGLVFNLMGCVNFISQMNAESLASMPEAVQAIVDSRPAWATGAFAIAVFGGVLGGILLLLKQSAAYHFFGASLVAAVAAQIPVLGMGGFPMLVGWLSQLVVTAFLIWYSRWCERKGWVR